MLEGLKRLLDNGDFTNKESLSEVRANYIRMSDSQQAFLMDKIIVVHDSFIPKPKLFLAYTDYCRDKGYPIISEALFNRELPKKLRVEEQRRKIGNDQIRGWVGIKINDE